MWKDIIPPSVLVFVILSVVIATFITSYVRPKKCVPILSNTRKDESLILEVPSEIPVWMFWDSEPLPLVVQLCWNNWCFWCEKSKNNFVPTLLTDQNVAQYIDLSSHSCFNQDTTNGPALRSDFIRLALLAKYGGVYMDATVVITEPLDWILGHKDRGHQYFQAMFNPQNMNISCKVPVIENSFMAAPPEHELIKTWLARISSLDDCQSSSIKRMVKSTPKQKNLDTAYHFVYHVLTQILIDNPIQDFGSFNLYDSVSQKYLNFHLQPVEHLIHKPVDAVRYGPLLKLVAWERKKLTKALSENRVVKGSFVSEFLTTMPYKMYF